MQTGRGKYETNVHRDNIILYLEVSPALSLVVTKAFRDSLSSLRVFALVHIASTSVGRAAKTSAAKEFRETLTHCTLDMHTHSSAPHIFGTVRPIVSYVNVG